MPFSTTMLISVITSRFSPFATRAPEKASMGLVLVRVAIVQQVNLVHQVKQQEEVTFGGSFGRTDQAMVRRTRGQLDNYAGIISEAGKDSGKVGFISYMTSDAKIVDLAGNIDVDLPGTPAGRGSITANLLYVVDKVFLVSLLPFEYEVLMLQTKLTYQLGFNVSKLNFRKGLPGLKLSITELTAVVKVPEIAVNVGQLFGQFRVFVGLKLRRGFACLLANVAKHQILNYFVMHHLISPLNAGCRLWHLRRQCWLLVFTVAR
ncbi:hypothetical protein AP1_0455 [Aeromonas phage AP1]|nr:hypothetical protein AP1_0455 [Aeromonas phage AP1]